MLEHGREQRSGERVVGHLKTRTESHSQMLAFFFLQKVKPQISCFHFFKYLDTTFGACLDISIGLD